MIGVCKLFFSFNQTPTNISPSPPLTKFNPHILSFQESPLHTYYPNNNFHERHQRKENPTKCQISVIHRLHIPSQTRRWRELAIDEEEMVVVLRSRESDCVGNLTRTFTGISGKEKRGGAFPKSPWQGQIKRYQERKKKGKEIESAIRMSFEWSNLTRHDGLMLRSLNLLF